MESYKVRLIGGKILLIPVILLLPGVVAFVVLERQFDLSMFVLVAVLVALAFASWKLEVTAREMRDGR